MHGKCMVSTPTISTPTISTCFTFPTLSNTNLPLPGGAGGGQDQADLEEEAGGISARGDLLHPLTILCLFTILGGDWARYTPLRHYAYHHVIAHHAPPSRHHVITSSRRAPRLSPAPHRTTLPQSIHTLSLSHPRRGKVTASLLTYLGTTYSPLTRLRTNRHGTLPASGTLTAACPLASTGGARSHLAAPRTARHLAAPCTARHLAALRTARLWWSGGARSPSRVPCLVRRTLSITCERATRAVALKAALEAASLAATSSVETEERSSTRRSVRKRRGSSNSTQSPS